MAVKVVIVIIGDGRTKRYKLINDREYQELCESLKVDGIRDADGFDIPNFNQIRNNETYTLGDPFSPPNKRLRDLSTLDSLELAEEIRKAAEPNFLSATLILEDFKTYRVPYLQALKTWNEDEIRNQLIELRDSIHQTLQHYQRNDRRAVVIGIRLGSGFGKTHVLTAAPELLDAAGLYITYNLGQVLHNDRASPLKCLYLRLILVLYGCDQRNTGMLIMAEESDPFRRLGNYKLLRTAFVSLAKSEYKARDIVIGVDEIMDLAGIGNANLDDVKTIISELSELSYIYSKTEPKSKCTCMVSSLNSESFQTNSGRVVKLWAPKHPDETTLEFFARPFSPERKETFKAMATATAGTHTRSIVVAFDEFRKDVEPTVNILLGLLEERLGRTLAKLRFIRNYITD